MKHPSTEQLALYAGGDLAPWPRLRTSLHLRTCAACASEVSGLSEACRRLREDVLEMPSGVNWDQLAAEMKANIRLGLAAGAIVDGANPPAEDIGFTPEPAGWRLAVVMATLAFVAAAGWMLRAPAPVPGAAGAAVILDASPDGIAWQRDGRAMKLLNPEESSVMTTVSWDGGARARYVDSQTGQVTIHNVYSE